LGIDSGGIRRQGVGRGKQISDHTTTWREKKRREEAKSIKNKKQSFRVSGKKNGGEMEASRGGKGPRKISYNSKMRRE